MTTDSIGDILDTFEEEDLKNLVGFIKRLKGHDHRKDLQLLDLYRTKGVIAKAEFSQILYPTGNNTAYQALRKRLIRMLNRFVVLKLMDSDSSQTSEVLGLVNMARYLFAHGKDHQGWKYLKKAERVAGKNSLFEILNSIYVLQIRHIGSAKGEHHSTLIAKWELNKDQLRKSELGEIALSLVSQKITEARKSKTFVDLDGLVQSVLNELEVSSNYLLEPRFVYYLASVNRKKMMLEKDYFNLEPFLIQHFENINNHKGFEPGNTYYKLGFLYMIAHVLYRNRKFELAIGYIAQLELELGKASKIQINEFGPKTSLLKGSLFIFTGKADHAVALFKEILTTQKNLTSFQRLATIANLGIAYFHLKKYHETHKTLQLIKHSDAWCEKVMGTEWVVKKSMMEAILYLELGELTLVDSRIKYIQRSFREFLNKPRYQRINTYVRFLQKLATVPTKDELEKLQMALDASFEWHPIEFEDLQAIAFYSWLKAKVLGLDAYDVMLELIE